MSRTAGVTVENNFTKGIVTEFSGLNFPENSCQDATNVIFTDKGEVVRRGGFDLEESTVPYDLASLTVDNKAATVTYHWRNAAPQTDIEFVVVQIKNLIHFYKAISSTLSFFKLPYILDMNFFRGYSGFDISQSECQFASGDGQLYIANGLCETLKITYLPSTNTFDVFPLSVRIRDFTVQLDYLPNEAQNTTLDDPLFHYNLRNQGWIPSDLALFFSRRNAYPSKSSTPWLYRNSQGFLNFIPTGSDIFTGNSLAPRGYYTLDAYNQDRSSTSGIAGIPVVTSQGNRPSCVLFFNNRIFLSGVNAEGFTGTIYFSKIIRDRRDEPVFYQVGDPTSEVNFQLLPNDGGYILIPEAGRIYSLKQSKNSLLVFATNGIWSITGSEGIGFTATDFAIEKISDVRCNNHKSFVMVDRTPIFWAPNGIFMVESANLGSFNVVSLTKPTIQTLYNDIPDECKKFAKGAYDPNTKEIYWIYSIDQNAPTDYTEVLVLRTSTQAFYKFKVSASDYKIKDVFSYFGLVLQDNNQQIVTTLLNDVINLSGGAVLSSSPSSSLFRNTFKFLTVKKTTGQTDKLLFSEINQNLFVDWNTAAPTEYVSSFISGYKLRGEGHRRFQIHYATIFSKFINQASCFMSTIWDYANTGSTGQFSSPQQAIKLDDRRDYNQRRLMIRGHGQAVQFKFESEGTKPFNIIGWSTSESVNDKI